MVPALCAGVVGALYLAWRSSTAGGVDPRLFWPLFGAEVFLYLRFLLRASVAWELGPSSALAPRSVRRVDIIVAAYAEPLDIVRATLIGCREVQYPHQTWLVDDRHRPELAHLAAEMGVGYLARDDTSHGRAGALSHALQHTNAEFALLLDADQVPLPDALHRTMGPFEDPAVAVVQTPFEYQNTDSVLHADEHRHERSLTNDVVNRGRDSLGAALWEGPSAVVRREALDAIGGIAMSGTAGELQTTIRLHAGGWKTSYVPVAIAHGLAAHDLKTLLRQRARWARGHLAVCTTRESPLWASGLSARQRLSHIELLSDYFVSLAHLAVLGTLVASLISGHLPMHAPPLHFLGAFGAWFVLSSWGRTALGRGRLMTGEVALHSVLTFQIHLGAIAAAVTGSRRRFGMNDGPRVDQGGFDVVRQLSLVAAATLVLEAAIALRLLDTLVGVPLPGRIGGLDLVVLTGISGMLLWFSLRVLGVFVSRRQRRAIHRNSIDSPGVINDRPVKLLDANTRSASVITTETVTVGQQVRLGLRVVRVDGTECDLWFDAIVRSSVLNQHHSRRRLGLQFIEADQATLDILVEYLAVVRPFHSLRSGDSTAVRG